jgi:4-cresol dehydrogenase (hydroxylating)
MTAVNWHAVPGILAERDPEPCALCRTRRRVPWRIRPGTIAAVQEVVRLAARNGISLYPVSGGKNWGYGSWLPPEDETTVLDLSGLKVIDPVDRATAAVRIEAGVTQIGLAEYLTANAAQFWCNVTGAGSATSILGNALERGIGYAGRRDQEIFGYEVVLPDGTLHRPDPEACSPALNRPCGLDVDSLWPQANLGIVVAARVRLRRHQEREDAVVLRGGYLDILETCRRALAEGILTLPVHIGEPGRTKRVGAGLLAYLLKREPSDHEVARIFPETGQHTALAAIHGRHAVVNAAYRELRKIAVHGVKLQRANARTLRLAERAFSLLGLGHAATRLAALRPLLALTWGEPSNVGLTALDPAGRSDPDRSAEGAFYLNCASSLASEASVQIETIFRAAWKDIALTRIALDHACLLTIGTLHFADRDAEHAHSAAREINASLRRSGFPPYRQGINDQFAPSALALRLKKALDPTGIIAPGRYGMR